MAHESGLTLAQPAVLNAGRDKTNEHKAHLQLLEGPVLWRQLVTGDAMFCQREFCQRVLDAGSDHLAFIKENQPTLVHDIEAAFAPATTGVFSPSAPADLGPAPGDTSDDRQGTRPSRPRDAEGDDGDDGAERLPGLATRGAGGTDRERRGAGRKGLAPGA
jgi:hypothetical protein